MLTTCLTPFTHSAVLSHIEHHNTPTKPPKISAASNKFPSTNSHMCLLIHQTYKCGHTKSNSLLSTYILDDTIKICRVQLTDALSRPCSKVEQKRTQVAPYKCPRCMGSLNWSKDYAQTNGWHGGRYLKDSSHG